VVRTLAFVKGNIAPFAPHILSETLMDLMFGSAGDEETDGERQVVDEESDSFQDVTLGLGSFDLVKTINHNDQGR